MNRQTDIAEELIDLGAVTDETRGVTPGILSDDKHLFRSPAGLSND